MACAAHPGREPIPLSGDAPLTRTMNDNRQGMRLSGFAWRLEIPRTLTLYPHMNDVSETVVGHTAEGPYLTTMRFIT